MSPQFGKCIITKLLTVSLVIKAQKTCSNFEIIICPNLFLFVCFFCFFFVQWCLVSLLSSKQQWMTQWNCLMDPMTTPDCSAPWLVHIQVSLLINSSARNSQTQPEECSFYIFFNIILSSKKLLFYCFFTYICMILYFWKAAPPTIFLFFLFFALLSCFRKRKIMKSSVRKQLWGAVEHSTSGRYHNLFDSDVFGENPLRVIFTRGNQQWKASHWGHTTYSSTDTP